MKIRNAVASAALATVIAGAGAPAFAAETAAPEVPKAPEIATTAPAQTDEGKGDVDSQGSTSALTPLFDAIAPLAGPTGGPILKAIGGMLPVFEQGSSSLAESSSSDESEAPAESDAPATDAPADEAPAGDAA